MSVRSLFRSAASRASRVVSLMRTAWIKWTYENVHIDWSVRLDKNIDIWVSDGGSLAIGPGSQIDRDCRLVARGGDIRIGSGCYIRRGTTITARDSIRIGNDVLIAEFVTIRDQDHRIDGEGAIKDLGFVCAPIVIGDGAWIAAKCTVLRGCAIGTGAVVGANSVVKGLVPDNAVVVGAPARLIRLRKASADASPADPPAARENS